MQKICVYMFESIFGARSAYDLIAICRMIILLSLQVLQLDAISKVKVHSLWEDAWNSLSLSASSSLTHTERHIEFLGALLYLVFSHHSKMTSYWVWLMKCYDKLYWIQILHYLRSFVQCHKTISANAKCLLTINSNVFLMVDEWWLMVMTDSGVDG